jgi:hypothetical protein
MDRKEAPGKATCTPDAKLHTNCDKVAKIEKQGQKRELPQSTSGPSHSASLSTRLITKSVLDQFYTLKRTVHI